MHPVKYPHINNHADVVQYSESVESWVEDRNTAWSDKHGKIF